MHIRQAQAKDGAAMDALLTKLIRFEAQFDANMDATLTVADNYARLLDEEDCVAFVAEENGEILGYLYGLVYEIPGMLHRPVARLDALYVQEAHRGKGAGKALCRAFAALAAERGAVKMELKVFCGTPRPWGFTRLWASGRRKNIWNGPCDGPKKEKKYGNSGIYPI